MKKRQSHISWLCVGVGLLSILMPTITQAGTPTMQIQATIDQVLTILKEPSPIKKDRRQMLREAIYPRFHFREMAMRALGSHWRALTPDERQEYTSLFIDVLQDAYAGKIESYQGEKVAYVGETRDGAFAEVKTILTAKKGNKYSLDYKLLLNDGDWKIYDIVIENVSLVNNYRSQFDRIIVKSSFQELLRRMREKQLGSQTKTQRQ